MNPAVFQLQPGSELIRKQHPIFNFKNRKDRALLAHTILSLERNPLDFEFLIDKHVVIDHHVSDQVRVAIGTRENSYVRMIG